MTDPQQIIKAAVQAIEDVTEHVFDPVGLVKKETLFNAFTHDKLKYVELNSLKQFLEEHLNPHLEALKGLIDEQM